MTTHDVRRPEEYPKARAGHLDPPADGKPTRILRDADGNPIAPPNSVSDNRPDDSKVVPISKDVAAPVKRDWLWRDLGELAKEKAAVHLVDGLLIKGNITLWYAPVKSGKSRMLMGLLAAMALDGPQFCGMDLAPTRTLLFSEEPPSVLGARVRDFQVPAGLHTVNTAAALALRAEDFAEEVLSAYTSNGGDFGLIAVDTLGAFVKCGDWNDYTATTAAMAPLRELARSLPNVAVLLLHHQNKAGGADWNGALGSTALAGNVDQIVAMVKKNGQHQITVGGREKSDPFPFDEPTTISISSSGVEFVGTATDEAGSLLAEHLGADPTTIKALADDMGDDGPSRHAVTKALKAMVEAGTAEVVEAGGGSKPALYRSVV